MRWPEWLSSSPSRRSPDNHPPHDISSPNNSVPPTDPPPSPLRPSNPPHSLLTPQTLFISLATALTTLGLTRFYRHYLRRYPNIAHLPARVFHRRSVYGYVTSVGDGDNFRLFHTPGGKLAGWGWLPGRRPAALPSKALRDRTLHVRIAGVDAPELAHFGRPAQPFSREAIEWLRAEISGRYVRVWPYRRDQYERVVCTVYRRWWGIGRSDVGLAMLKRGLATVYEAKFGSEFGNKEEIYRAAEERAKARGVGMWKDHGLVGRLLGKKNAFESPREYKTRMAKEESTK